MYCIRWIIVNFIEILYFGLVICDVMDDMLDKIMLLMIELFEVCLLCIEYIFYGFMIVLV